MSPSKTSGFKKVVQTCCALGMGLSLGSVEKVKALGVDGSFVSTGYNNPIQISDLSIQAYEPSAQAYVGVSTLTPTQTHRIVFTVSDYDGLKDVLIEVSLLHDEDGFIDADQNGVDDSFESVSGINSDGDQFDFYWNPSLGQEPVLLTQEGAISSWAMVSHNLASIDLNAVSATFSFDFTVSKAAQADGLWTLNVRVMDDYTGSVLNPTSAVARLAPLSVQWYGEILMASQSLTWGTLDQGLGYDAISSKAQLDVLVRSNGAYAQQVSADPIWSGERQSDTALGVKGDSVQADLVDDPLVHPNQSFAIRVNTQDSALKGYTSDFIQLSALSQILSQSPLKTTESGQSMTLSFYLSRSQAFQNGAYQGTLYVGIINPIQD